MRRYLIGFVGLSLILTQASHASLWTKLNSMVSSLFNSDKSETEEVKFPSIPSSIPNTQATINTEKTKVENTEFDKLSPEDQKKYHLGFLREIFQVTRGAEPHQDDYSKWLNTLMQGGSREGVYRALVLDEVYAILEDSVGANTDLMKKFVTDYSKKFYANDFSQEKLDKYNTYTIKRILTEKGLELIDYYEATNMDELCSWYGHFSSYLTQQEKLKFQGPIRDIKDVKTHYDWAKNVPVQLVKSEFIIKLNMAIDQLSR